VFGFLGVRRLIHLEAEVLQARQDASAVSQQYRRELETAAESEEKNHSVKQELSQRIADLEKALKPLKASDIRVPLPVHDREPPEVNFPIFALVAVSRGQGPAPVSIDLPISSPRFAISVPIEDRRDFASYRVTIVNSDREVVWKRAGFTPDAYHSLSMSLKSSFLPSGNYELSVEGLTVPSQWTTVGSYPFRVARHR
jgi:hypothetical protein